MSQSGRSRARQPSRPVDPERRRVIARAAIEIVGECGVEGLTHRAVAAAADVPLGSTTYYFATLEDILEAAMEEAVSASGERARAWARTIPVREDLGEALARYLESATGPGRARLVVEYELYLAAIRHPRLRPLSTAWGQVLTEILATHTDRLTARALTVAYFGLQLESLIGDRSLPADETRPVFRRVLAGAR